MVVPGGYSDIFQGSLEGELVAIKVLRGFSKSGRTDSITLRQLQKVDVHGSLFSFSCELH